ncbi:hypothetical protein ACI2OX_11600 [Bacillus sp. N9]
MVTYSSYLGKEESLPKSASLIVMMNIFISLFAGLAIFPAVFSLGMEPTEGPGLLFVVLPAVFNQMPFGMVFLNIFLLLFYSLHSHRHFPCLRSLLRHLRKTMTKSVKESVGSLVCLSSLPEFLRHYHSDYWLTSNFFRKHFSIWLIFSYQIFYCHSALLVFRSLQRIAFQEAGYLPS